MNYQGRMYSKTDEDFSRLTLEELRAKVAEAQMTLHRVTEQEQKLRHEIKSQNVKSASPDDQDFSLLAFTRKEAEETVALIEKNTEQKIKGMVREVKEVKAKYDKEKAEIQERIDIKKRYIISMFESLKVYLDNGNNKRNTKEEVQTERSDKTQVQSSAENGQGYADSELQSLLKQIT